MNRWGYIVFIILVVLTGCSGGGEEQPPEAVPAADGEPLVLIIKDRTDTTSVRVSSQITKALEYTRIPFATRDMSLAGEKTGLSDTIQLVYQTTGKTNSISDALVDSLLAFVATGGRLVFTEPQFDDRFAFFIGLDPSKGYEIDRKAEGFSFRENIFPGFDSRNIKIASTFSHQGLDGNNFTAEPEVLAAAVSDSTYPVITRNKLGKGGVIYFNTFVTSDKDYRGLLFSSGLPALTGIPYSIANISTIFLDDFPAPLYQEELPPIDEEYGLNHAEFVTGVWWPDMKTLADSLGLDYTAVLCFNYNANVVPPFDFNEWLGGELVINGEQRNGSIWLAQQVQQSRHELGFHGYNHFSLWRQDWPNLEFMISAVQAARKRWTIDGLGTFPATYVPPTNRIDSLGLVALSKGMPSVQYMSSLYLGDFQSGEGREFGKDPLRPSYFDYPRISSGFAPTDDARFNMHSLYLISGIWNHFVHPDDVFQLEKEAGEPFSSRNPFGLGWHSDSGRDYGLYEVFRDWIINNRNNYPLMRFSTAEKSVPVVQQWLAGKSRYRFDDRQMLVSPSANKAENRDRYWFMYVEHSSVSPTAEALQSQGIEVKSTDIWRGKLMQFKTVSDSLYLPSPLQKKGSGNRELLAEIRKEYRSAMGLTGPMSPDELEAYENLRLERALSKLQNHPDSLSLQEEVINLAVSFDTVSVALPILEERLLANPNWREKDIERLLTYYGFQNAYARAYRFLEKLWATYPGRKVIGIKNRMVKRYGVPGDEFHTKWLLRELRLKPGEEEVLSELVYRNQSQEDWPRSKRWLTKLIRLNPSSDTLYHFTLQRSFYYDSPNETLELIEGFPASAEGQLEPLGRQIANLYAYSAKEYGKALEWADKVNGFEIQTKLVWLLEEKRFDEFKRRGRNYLADHPEDDSTRVFVGQQLIYGGLYEDGYKVLYPLFEKGNAPQRTQNLIHREIGYQGYSRKKSFYRKYPAFFSDSLRKDLNNRYRKNEGVMAGLTGSFVSDNFSNEIADMGAFAEWGNRRKYLHRLTADETFVGSEIGGVAQFDRLSHISYRYQHKSRQQTRQFTAGGGFYYIGGEVFPDAVLGGWFANDSTFTSGQLSLKPELTNSALSRHINRFRTTIYREDNWLKGALLTGLSLVGNYYTDEVYSYEIYGRTYYRWPFSTENWRYRAVGEISFSDATLRHINAVPYFTPRDLFIKGFGMDIRYSDMPQTPDFSAEVEFMGKHDNRDGFFLTAAARLNARIKQFWEISLNANISSSSVYSYNNFNLTVTYLLPDKLAE